MIIKMVNEFKLTVVHFARPNPMQFSVHARGFTAEQKNCGKSGLGQAVGQGPRAAGPLGRRGPRACF